MGGILISESSFNFHTMTFSWTPRWGSPEGERELGHNAGTAPPWLRSSYCAALLQKGNAIHLSGSDSPLEPWDPLPPIYKVSPPPMKHRDSEANLMPSMGHLRSNQSDGSPYPLDVFLSIKRRQHQIPTFKGRP